jgi:hypothetical protein
MRSSDSGDAGADNYYLGGCGLRHFWLTIPPRNLAEITTQYDRAT